MRDADAWLGKNEFSSGILVCKFLNFLICKCLNSMEPKRNRLELAF